MENGISFFTLSLVRSSRLKKLKSSLCTFVTSRVSQGPKQSSLTKMCGWDSQNGLKNLLQRLLVARIDFPKPVQFKNGLHVSSCPDVCSRMFKDMFHLRQEDSFASRLVSQSWSHKKHFNFHHVSSSYLPSRLCHSRDPRGPSFPEAGIHYSSYNLRRWKWRKMCRSFPLKIVSIFNFHWSWKFNG